MNPTRHFEAVAVPDHPGDKHYLPGAFISHRMPDAVRAAALANAVDLLREWQGVISEETPISSWTNRVLETARLFEAYLVGEEANGPS